MSKEDILHCVQDINFRYNDCMMYDNLSRMLDELIEENKPTMEEGQLNAIRGFIVKYIMRDPYVMFSVARDMGQNHIDLIYVIASLYEELHKQVMGEPYEYMFHWANKCGSWVEDDLFNEENFKQFLVELSPQEERGQHDSNL